jgi:hypothetical protein
VSQLNYYTPRELIATEFGDVDLSEELGSTLKCISTRTIIAPTRVDLLHFLTRSSAAAMRSLFRADPANSSWTKRCLVTYCVVGRGTLTWELAAEAILETRPRDVMFDPDALSLRMVKESSPVANLTLCDGVSLEDAVRDGQERGFSFSLGDEA